MKTTLLRALRLIIAPGNEWRVIGNEDPHTRASIMLFVLPLALIPAASWSLHLLLSGGVAAGEQTGAPRGIAQIIQGGLTAYVGVVLSIALSGVAIFVLAPVFGRLRDWPRALRVAAYSATPLLLGGIVLGLPDLASLLVFAFFHGLYLQYSGLQHVLAVKEGEAAEYVALSTVLLFVLSTVISALGGWLGVL